MSQGAEKNGISSETVDLAVEGSSRMAAYVARPNASGRHPGLMVFQEAYGVNHHIRDVTERFAAQGYVAIAPELFHRTAPKGFAGDYNNFPSVKPHYLAVTSEAAEADIRSTYEWLHSSSLVQADRISCVGFCMGGRTTLLYACSSNRLSAAIDCWGGGITADAAPVTAQRPTPIIDLVPRLSCPLYVVCGEEDGNPSPAQVEVLRQRLQQAGKTFTIDMFKNAGHAFFADYRPSYREKAAFELWPKTAAFFDTHLKGKK